MLIYLDTETTKFFADVEIARLPRAAQIPALAAYVGVAITYDAASGWREWWPGAWPALWAALRGQQIAGWNVVHFDAPLIQQAAALAGVSDPGLDPWTALDLFAEIRTRTSRWYKLEEIAQANLGRGKSGDGQSASEWLRSGDPDLAQRAAEYCRLDVQLVIDLHALAQTDGLVCPARGKDNSAATYRFWIDATGERWQIAIDGGAMLDSEGWSTAPAQTFQWQCLDCGHCWNGRKKCPQCGALEDEIIHWTPKEARNERP